MDKMKNCQNCKFWEPLWSGRDFGVRSLVDATPEQRDPIMAEVKRRTDSKGYDYDGPDEFAHMRPDQTNGRVPKHDWPMWGECARAEMDGDAAAGSIAVAKDASDYEAKLRTRCNFCCVQWEAM